MSDEIIEAMADNLREYGMKDEGCFVVEEFAADLYHMTLPGSSVNPTHRVVTDELKKARKALLEMAHMRHVSGLIESCYQDWEDAYLAALQGNSDG